MTDFNPQDFTRQSVTPIKRKVNGVVYERTGEKREPKPGELIWFDAQQPEPYEFVPGRWRGLDLESVCERCGRLVESHQTSDLVCPGPVTPIWIRSEDQSWEPPSFPEIKDEGEIDRLIRQLRMTETGLGNESIPALGILYQAKALERIAAVLEHFDTFSNRYQFANAARHVGPSPEASESRAVCSMCNHGEHGRCDSLRYIANEPGTKYLPLCECPICHQAPNVQTPHGNVYHFDPHPFEGMEDNHFCTKCGGGRLHAIHQ